MALGIRESAEYAVRSGIKHIQFAVRSEEEAKAIDSYLISLEPVASPWLRVNGKLSKLAKRGEKIFISAGCADCHSGTLYTDMRKHNIETGVGRDRDKAFDTPTLIEIWRTAPYLNDGSAATLFSLFREFNSDDQHGVTSNLTDTELTDLVTYLNSL